MKKEELLKAYPYKTELHLHSMPVSTCCTCPMERCIELYAERNVNAICVTNHFFNRNRNFTDKTAEECVDFYISGYEQFKELAKPYGINVLLGMELRFDDDNNHYLIYGVDRDIVKKSFPLLSGTLEEYREKMPLENSIIIQAHPFRDDNIPADSELIDGFETMNFVPDKNNRNSVCAEYAKENNISICTCGSDFHYDKPYYPAPVLMLSKKLPEDSFELAKIIKENDSIFLLGDNHIIIP